uniref:response regulator n=1 Tax=Pararhizobium sp. IMCC3301 TaxID=3067904 RepID=UPI002742936C|nr:response regulator [Pararhizobium sp. IMCC3301]
MYDLSDLSIAIADDSAFFRKVLSTILRGFGIRQIFEAEDGAKCLSVINGQNPDILFLDWEMPAMRGPDVMRKIRTRTAVNPFLPVIMVTSHAERQHVEYAASLGIHEMLTKPIAAKPVYQRLSSMIQNPRPFIQNGAYFGPIPRQAVKCADAISQHRPGSVLKNEFVI